MAGGEEEEVYQGVVQKLSKDGAQYIIECAVVSGWYKTAARLDAEWAPEGLEIGDTVRFTVSETGLGAPAVSWVERRKPKKRKAEEVAEAEAEAEETNEPAEGEELYEGTVGNPTRDEQHYLVDCPCLSEYYGVKPKVSAEKLFLASAGTGDEIVFSLEPIGTAPMVAWAEKKGSAAAKRRLKGEAPEKKKEKGAPAKEKTATLAVSDELAQLKAQLAQEKEAKLEAQLAATKMELAHVQQKVAVSAAPAAAAARPAAAAGEDWEGDAEVGRQAPAAAARPPPTIKGSVRFETGDHALQALSLFGTELNGQQIKVELDTANLSLVRVKLGEGTTAEQLWAHFEKTGRIECAEVGTDDKKMSKAALKGFEQSEEKKMKGKGVKGVKGGKDAGKGGKNAGKGKAAAGKGALAGKGKAPAAGKGKAPVAGKGTAAPANTKGGAAPSAKGKSKGTKKGA